MGTYVHTSVVFACNHNEPLAALAKKHLALMEAPDGFVKTGRKIAGLYDEYVLPEGCRASSLAVQFLSDMADRTGDNPGPKGGVCLWGQIRNGTEVYELVEELRPFWLDLLANDELAGSSDALRLGTCIHEHVIVFYEEEQTEKAKCYEIRLTDDAQDRLGDERAEAKLDPATDIEIRHHVLPFAWMQY